MGSPGVRQVTVTGDTEDELEMNGEVARCGGAVDVDAFSFSPSVSDDYVTVFWNRLMPKVTVSSS